MSHAVLSPGPLTRAAKDLTPRLWVLGGLGLGPSAAAMLVDQPRLALGLYLVGLTFFALVALTIGLNWRYRRACEGVRDVLSDLVAADSAPSLMTDGDGAVIFANEAAQAAFGNRNATTLPQILSEVCAQPATFVGRLQNRALALGSAREGLAIRGGELAVAVHRVGREAFMWRIEEAQGGAGRGHSGDAIGLPMLTASRSGTILYMNEALRRMLGGRETTLDRVFTDLPLRPGQVHEIQGAQGPRPVLVVEVELSAGRREIYLLPEPERPLIGPGEWGVVESLPVPLLKLDHDGRVTMANARARALLGQDAVIGLPLAELVEGLGRPLDDWLDDAWAGRNLGCTETVSAARREEETFLQISLDLVREEGGTALVAVMSDATQLKSLENQFVQSQKMQAIGQLAGGVAHDFNNLLTAISGHCDLLLLRHGPQEEDYADLRQISQNANRAAALVRQLLAFSRKQTLRPDVIDLSDCMADLVHLLGRLVGETVSLNFVHDADVRPVRADKRQLEQVVMNLVVNARDAMPGGGAIGLEVRNLRLARMLERDRVRVPPGDYVTIQVTDTGEGIAPERIGKIFEPFFTTKRAGKGTGLGLSMAYGIVKQSGGFIFVDSVEGTGTTFSLYFPAYVPRAGQSERPVPAATGTGDLPRPTHDGGHGGGGCVLLVEDEAPVRAFAARALALRGYEVIEAESAEAALELLTDRGLSVDVVVTDVIMPGMDGPTWVSRALEDRPGIRVVFVSGYAEESVSERQKRIPNSVFLPKPFSLSELTETVAAQIH